LVAKALKKCMSANIDLMVENIEVSARWEKVDMFYDWPEKDIPGALQ
jgi:hypothetical protein